MCHLIGISIVIEVWNRCEESTAGYRNMVARWTLAWRHVQVSPNGRRELQEIVQNEKYSRRGIEVNQILFPDSIDNSKRVTLG